MGRSAVESLRLLDKLLAERPEPVGQDFTAATRWIAVYRDELIASWRRTGDALDRQRLGQVNAVLSAVVGGHYPLTATPWEAIRKARDQLALVIGETA